MELALQTSSTAREMIATMGQLVDTHGYGGTPNVTDDGGWGSGESFTIADTKEVWHMELIGKGAWNPGAVWVVSVLLLLLLLLPPSPHTSPRNGRGSSPSTPSSSSSPSA